VKRQPKIREEEIKGRVRDRFFARFDCTAALGAIDFTVKDRADADDRSKGYYLWAEAKADDDDATAMLAQLVLTIGKARTFDDHNPPPFLGCFDSQAIVFVPYHRICDIFYQSDFNWNVAPSDRSTKEFKQAYEKVRQIVGQNNDLQECRFSLDDDAKELEAFVKANFVPGKAGATKIQIDKNNFMIVYGKWVEAVKPTIQINWDEAKKFNIIAGDFYLADLLSSENKTLKEKLFVVLQTDRYRLDRQLDNLGLETARTAEFTDGQKAHARFWAKYERPPAEQYWDYIVERRDLLLPQDVRERKGSFFTPRKWVELSQRYIADALGVDWQDEYYVWDCAAGTGSLLAGLTNKYNIWASTLDQADVDAMKDRIRNGANLLESHVFRFDFLNDDFKDLPEGLRSIIEDPEKRRKLVVYINPPYAEAASSTTKTGTGKNKGSVASAHMTSRKYKKVLGRGINELFANFFIRVYSELPDATLAAFSTLKHLNSQNFVNFRQAFLAKCLTGFICPADTFDNVTGQFPIGFLVWDLATKQAISDIETDVYESDGQPSPVAKKRFYAGDKGGFIVDWVRKHFDKTGELIGHLRFQGTDFQTSSNAYTTSCPSPNDIRESKVTSITKNNLADMCVYLAVRHCIEATWLNDRDQFMSPGGGAETDEEFRNDCLAFVLFHGQNRIQSRHGPNHWIPFREAEVGAKDKFASSFMADFIAGKVGRGGEEAWTVGQETRQGGGPNGPLEFSAEAQAVFDAGRDLWRHYHSTPGANANASLYDIRELFKGRDEKGRMNAKSGDDRFNALDAALRAALKALAKKIEPKVYEYGFLKG